MRSIIIQSAGLLTTVQDTGRFGYQRFGMPVSGAMDTFSLKMANKLVGNNPNAACLESTILGPEIVFTDSGSFAVCGADMSPIVNGKPVPGNRKIEVQKGDILFFKGLKSGCRSYIAFAGGIDVPVVMGSRSTYLGAKIGGFHGRVVKQGDELPLGDLQGKSEITVVPPELLQLYPSSQTIRIIPGPEVKRFGWEGINTFLTSEYAVTDNSNRMGYRLKGQKIEQQTGASDIISAGISFGTIQISSDGQPIILMADRQTTGGYARIANVISVDHTLLAQLKPGDNIRFSEVSLDFAQELYVERQRILEMV